MKTITIRGIVGNAFDRGIRNVVSLFVNITLWIITIWIPYLNVGTTIGVMMLAAKMNKNETISFTEIFKPVYRKRIGEVFLALGFMYSAILIGMIFIIVPGIVIGISWSLAPLLVVENGMDPLSAIKKSDSLTDGKKWTIFIGYVMLAIAFGAIVGVVVFLFSLLNILVLTILAGIVLSAIAISILVGAQSYIYGELMK